LKTSLERLGVSSIDLYMLHRDNPDMPVSEIVDTMHHFVTEGFISVWGVSNWSTERIDLALQYARDSGKSIPVCDSLQASLAEPSQAVWPGTAYMTDERAGWYSGRPVAVLAWECLAKGFMAGRWGADVKSVDERSSKRQRVDTSWRESQLEEAYLTQENIERRDRVQELATKKGVEMSQIALAYVLAQQYNSFVLVGTTKASHFQSNAASTAIKLTADEVLYLRSGASGTMDIQQLEDELFSPAQLHRALPGSRTACETVKKTREALCAAIEGKDDRLMVLVGPCSIHDTEAALDYAAKLAPLASQYEEDLVVVMRVYFEKPRTTVGWKGLISDPDMNGTFQVGKGLQAARKLLLDINNMGLSAGTEFLSSATADYFSDLVSYGAIGARTTESQTHREMASGLGMPVGFKNATSGDVQVAVDAIGSAKAAHSYLGSNTRGRPAVIQTGGNPHSHLILRGGAHGPNYEASHVRDAEAKLKGKSCIVVDCSHGNSNKQHENQPKVADNIAQQIMHGNRSVMGVMIESHLVAGNQSLKPGVTDPKTLVYGQSVTDACIDFDTTADVLANLASAVQARRRTGLA